MLCLKHIQIKSIHFFCFILFLSLVHAYADDSSVNYPMGFTGEINMLVMKRGDFLGGGSFYVPLIWSKGLSAYTGFDMRAGKRSVLVKTQDAYIQYKERRCLLEFGIDESVAFSGSFGFYIRGGYGYTFAWYKGSSADADAGFTPTLQPGFFFVSKGDDLLLRYRFRFGYTFIKTRTSGPHGFNISFQVGGAR